MDDPSFELDRPCPKAARYKGIKMKDRNIKIIDCPICTMELDIPKRVSQCDFCGTFGCIDCVYKKFPFPHCPTGLLLIE